jgi:hypothetical protein
MSVKFAFLNLSSNSRAACARVAKLYLTEPQEGKKNIFWLVSWPICGAGLGYRPFILISEKLVFGKSVVQSGSVIIIEKLGMAIK